MIPEDERALVGGGLECTDHIAVVQSFTAAGEIITRGLGEQGVRVVQKDGVGVSGRHRTGDLRAVDQDQVGSTRNHLIYSTLDNVRSRLYRLAPTKEGWSKEEIELPGIDNVRNVASLIDETRRQERRRRGLHVESI